MIVSNLFSDVSGLLTAAGTALLAGATFTSVFRNSKKIDSAHKKLDVQGAQITQVDAAVNGKPPGETTMVSQVQDIHDKQFPLPVENGDAVLPRLQRIEALLRAQEARAE